MAKKRAINKSEEIRIYKGKHPNEKPLAIAKALTAKTGIEFSASSVSSVLYQQKNKGGAKKARGRKAGATGGATSSVVAAIDAASNLIDAAGSIDAAKMILEKIGDTRSR